MWCDQVGLEGLKIERKKTPSLHIFVRLGEGWVEWSPSNWQKNREICSRSRDFLKFLFWVGFHTLSQINRIPLLILLMLHIWICTTLTSLAITRLGPRIEPIAFPKLSGCAKCYTWSRITKYLSDRFAYKPKLWQNPKDKNEI